VTRNDLAVSLMILGRVEDAVRELRPTLEREPALLTWASSLKDGARGRRPQNDPGIPAVTTDTGK